MQNKQMDLFQFKDMIKEKKCICFGSGLQGLRFIAIMRNWGYEDRIVSFIDNNDDRKGQKIEYLGCSYRINSLEDSLSMIDENTAIIITSTAVVEIKEQLEHYQALDKNICLSLSEIGRQELLVSDYKEVIFEVDSPIIPKKLHYCWLGNEMPRHIRTNIEKWKEMCPDYEIVEWNEKNYDFKKNVYMKEAFELEKWGYVPDYARLDIIYEYGGIYMDTDVEIVKNLDDLLYQRCFGSSDCSMLLNLGSGFGAAPKQGIIKELRDYYDVMHFVDREGIIDRRPCQLHQYDAMKKYNIQINDQYQRIKEMNIYPMIMAGTNAYTMEMRVTDKTYFLHYGTAAWLSDEFKEQKRKLREKYFKCDDLELSSYYL